MEHDRDVSQYKEEDIYLPSNFPHQDGCTIITRLSLVNQTNLSSPGTPKISVFADMPWMI